MHSLQRLIASPRSQALVFRVIGHAGLAILALSLPTVGPNRFLLAGLLVGFVSPVAILLNRRLDDSTRNWAEALFDLVMVVVLVHLVPHLWISALAIGLMVAIAPSIGLHPASHWIYLAFGVVLVGGMTLALVVHDVQGWLVPMAAVAVTYPSMLYYTYTQMQRANDLRERAQLLQSLADLAGAVGHDFNNAMVGIVTSSELAAAKLPSDHPAREDLGAILDGTERARRLCRQLLSFAGRGVAHRGRIEMSAELHALANLLQPALPGNVRFELECEEPLSIEADVPRVHYVLMGTMLHAGDTMRERPGPIRMRLGRTAEDPARVEIRIQWPGNGPTTGAGVVALLRASSSGGRWSLDEAQRIMSDLGGSLTLRADGGTTEAILRWPEWTSREGAGAQLDEPSHAERIDPHVQSFLIIDDDDGVRRVTRRLLEKLGYGVITARTADHGVEAFARSHQTIQGVLLDLRMPGRDGWSCLADLRNICPTTRIVVYSGFDPAASSPAGAREDPHLGFLQKPFLIQELTDALGLDPVARSTTT